MQSENTESPFATKLRSHRKSLRWLAAAAWGITGIVVSIGAKQPGANFHALAAFLIAGVQVILALSNSAVLRTPEDAQADARWKDSGLFQLATIIFCMPWTRSDGVDALVALSLGVLVLVFSIAAL